MSRPLLTRSFWLDTLERAIKTAAQSLLAAIVGTAAVTEFDWGVVLLTTGVATGASVLTSIISSGIGEPGTASILNPAPPDTLG